jgi:hypothetical protein
LLGVIFSELLAVRTEIGELKEKINGLESKLELIWSDFRKRKKNYEKPFQVQKLVMVLI